MSGQLSRVLSWQRLVLVKMGIKTFLLCVEVNVLSEKLIDLFPFSMLSKGHDGSGFLTFGDDSAKACEIVFLVESGVYFAKGHDISLIFRAENDVVLKGWNRYMPKVKFSRHELQKFGGESNLGSESCNRFKHCASKSCGWLQKLLEGLAMFDRVQEHLVNAIGEELLLLARQDGPKLTKKLSEENVSQRFVIMICWVDADHFGEWV